MRKLKTRLTKKLQIDKSFNNQHVDGNERLYFVDDGFKPQIRTDKRVGIDYAGEEWAAKPWRFILDK